MTKINKTFDTVDYSNFKNLSNQSINNCNITISTDIANKNVIDDTLSKNNNENRMIIFFYGIMSNINEIITMLPEQINIIKQNPLYTSALKISCDEKIAIATTLAFLLNLYYII